jgi:hypothetical protein
MAGLDPTSSNVSTREYVERQVIHPAPKSQKTVADPAPAGGRRPVEVEGFRKMTSSPSSSRTLQKYQEGIGDLGYVTIHQKLDQARAETDPEKRGNLLVDAQTLMTEYLNVARDSSLPTAVKEKIRGTLQDYLHDVKTLAPNYVDLPYVQGANCSPQESYQRLESLVKKDPDLANLNVAWEARKKNEF